MEDEIDLRAYVNILMRYKWVIIGLTFICGLVTFVTISILPPKYQATALVAITRPLYQFQFTPSIQNVTDREAAQKFTGKAGAELATSDSLLQQTLNIVQYDIQPQDRFLHKFRKKIRVSAGRDPSILKFEAIDKVPLLAMNLANTLAARYVQYVNELYGQSATQKTFFDEQLKQAGFDLDKAEQTLIEFQKRNNATILNAHLASNQAALNTYLALTESLKLLLQNVCSLHDQLARQPAGNPSPLIDELTVLIMQINAFSIPQMSPQMSPQMPMPIQLQLPSVGNLTNKTAGQQVAYLRELARTIEARLVEIKKRTDAMPKNILTLQEQIQKISTENAKLNRQRELAQSVFTSLAQKSDETRITSQESSGRVRIASYAAIPEKPVGDRLTKTAIALFMGLFLSIFGVFIYDFFRKSEAEAGENII